jgi:rhodanese-related sulfurtransferase
MSCINEFSIPIESIDKDELLMRLNGGSDFVLVDTIGSYDGNRFRIKGAKTIPYPEVIDRRKELSGHDEIIIYCKHSGCRASKKAASGLILLNVSNVKVYEGGIDEWVESGLPVEDV